MAKHLRIADETPLQTRITKKRPGLKKRRKKSTKPPTPGRTRVHGAGIQPVKDHGYERVDKGLIMLADLCHEYGLTATVARNHLRAAGLEHTGRWKWKKGSTDLAKARRILSAILD